MFPDNVAVRLLGDGRKYTYLYYFYTTPGWDEDKDLIQLTGDYQSVEGMTLQHGGQFTAGEGAGVRLRRPVEEEAIYGTILRDLVISKPPGCGIIVDATPVDDHGQFGVYNLYDNIDIDGHRGTAGICINSQYTTTQYLKNCHVHDGYGNGIQVDGAKGVSIIDCIAENLAYPIVLIDAGGIIIDGCWFEGGSEPFIDVTGSSSGVSITTCCFVKGATNLLCIRVKDTATGIVISDCWIATSGTPTTANISIASGCEATVIGGVVNGAGNKLIVSDSSTKSTLVGSMWRFRLPRVSSSDLSNMAAPQVGDMIYDTTVGKARIYDGSNWQSLW